MDGNVFHVSIANCNNVVIVSNFLVNTYGLRSISFTNLRNLTLQQSALSFPQLLSSTRLIIDFNNVTIKEIQSHAFNGNIDEITFTSTQIDLIRPFAFTAFRDKAYFIKFIDTVFKLVEPQVRYLHIKFWKHAPLTLSFLGIQKIQCHQVGNNQLIVHKPTSYSNFLRRRSCGKFVHRKHNFQWSLFQGFFIQR